MNFLFTFDEHIDCYVLTEFQIFAWDLAEINVMFFSANDNDEGAEFPVNFIMAYPDTDNEEHIEILSHKYAALCKESPFINTDNSPVDFGRAH